MINVLIEGDRVELTQGKPQAVGVQRDDGSTREVPRDRLGALRG